MSKRPKQTPGPAPSSRMAGQKTANANGAPPVDDRPPETMDPAQRAIAERGLAQIRDEAFATDVAVDGVFREFGS